MSRGQIIVLRAVAILWVLWGLVHMLAGVMTITQAPPSAFAGIADAVEPALLQAAYHPAVGAVLNQHGFNLLWIGLVTLTGAGFIWRGRRTALWVTAMIGGLADLGYFIFLDLGGFVHFVPGSVMTLISATAIVLSVWIWRSTAR